MNISSERFPVLYGFYQDYLSDTDIARYQNRVSGRYTPATLERLIAFPNVSVQRAAVLALGLVGDFQNTSSLAQALHSSDKMTAMLAEVASRTVWKRFAQSEERRILRQITDMNQAGDPSQDVAWATALLERTPKFAEVRYQRGRAWYLLGQNREALSDFRQTLAANPFHFDAARMMAHCFIEMGDSKRMLRAFQMALELNPNLKTVSIRQRCNASRKA